MNQSKLESGLEVFFNYLSGFVIAYLTYRFAVMPYEWLRTEPAMVTMIFTVVSVGRSYFWRRFFNRGLHKVIHKVISTLYKRKKV